METNWIDIATLIVAAIALILSILGYWRSRTIDNENQLFNVKMQAYQIITTEIAAVTNIIEISTVKFKNLTGLSEEDRDKLIESIVNEIFNGLHYFRMKVAGHLFLLPEDINAKIELFYGSYINDKAPAPDWENPYRELESSIDLLYSRANAVYDAIREDLNLDVLHSKLLKRTAPIKYLP